MNSNRQKIECQAVARSRRNSVRDIVYWWAAFLFVSGLALTQVGCGPSKEVLEAQDRDLQEAYEQASENPANLPPHLQERRKWRLEKEYGQQAGNTNSDSTSGKQ